LTFYIIYDRIITRNKLKYKLLISGVFALHPGKPPTAVGASQGRAALVARRNERNLFALKASLLFLVLFLFRKKGREKEHRG
jgi:hypothetical protein